MSGGDQKDPKPTRDDVERLKRNWSYDPHWDIEDTDGYEEYRDELAQYHIEFMAKQKADEEMRLFELSRQLGVPGNLDLARYVDKIDAEMQSLRDRIGVLEHKVN